MLWSAPQSWRHLETNPDSLRKKPNYLAIEAHRTRESSLATCTLLSSCKKKTSGDVAVEASGIEPYPALFEKQRRCATFVVKSGKGNELRANSLSP